MNAEAPSTASVNDIECEGGKPEATDGEPPCKYPRKEREPVPDGMSKKQWRRQQKSERYLSHRAERRAKEKAAKKAKRDQLRADGRGHELARGKIKKMADSECKIRVAVDMSFDDKMNQKDQKRTVLQLGWAYSANRRAENPLQFHVVGFSGTCKNYFDDTYLNWDVHVHSEPLESTFETNEIVYLTADSENVLERLDDSKVYVIGGIIDHNSEKLLCYNIAKERGYAHARLPLDEYVKMSSRKVLTINHVFEILLHFSGNGDWEKAFFAVLPERKGAQKLNSPDPSQDNEKQDNDADDGIKIDNNADPDPELSTDH